MAAVVSSVSFVGKTKTPSLLVCHLAWKTSVGDVEESSASFAEKMRILSVLVAPEPKGSTFARPNPRIPAMGSMVPMVCNAPGNRMSRVAWRPNATAVVVSSVSCAARMQTRLRAAAMTTTIP